MGLRALGLDPVYAVMDVITSTDDVYRRYDVSRRVRLYRDDFETPLQEQISIIFRDEAVRTRLYQLARLSGSSSLVKRVADELARPIYAQPPRRTVMQPESREPAKEDQKAYRDLVTKTGLDRVMDLVARLLIVTTSVFIVPRVVEKLGPHTNLLTPDCASVLPFPGAPTVSLALIYDSERVVKGQRVRTYVVLDDEDTWEIDSAGALVQQPTPHNLKRKPWVELHRVQPWGCYWNYSVGRDLEAAALQSMLLDCIKLKKHKSQSHIQLVFSGETDGFIKDQTLDEESVLAANGSGTLTPINLEANPAGILASVDALEMKSAANYGLSMDRMNHKGGGDDDGLSERVAELIKVLSAGEIDLFDLWRAIGRTTGAVQLSDDSYLSVDYGALHHRVDRQTQLEIHETEVRLGVASPLDAIYEKNPEIEDDKTAWAEFEKNLADRAVAVEMLRALNMTADGSPAMPGQDAKQNGALGPAVRDGKISGDAAAEQAKTGSPSRPNVARGRAYMDKLNAA